MPCRNTCWELCSNVDVPELELHQIANLELKVGGPAVQLGKLRCARQYSPTFF